MDFQYHLFLCYLAGLAFLGLLFAVEAVFSHFEGRSRAKTQTARTQAYAKARAKTRA